MPGKKKPEKKIAAKKAPPIQGAPVVQVSEGTAPLAPIPPPPPTTDVDFLERQAAMRAVASQANSEGHLALVLGDEAPNPYIIRRPTGIMNLDIDLGGGFPAGGTCFVSGLDCVGKTWLMLLTMAMQQMIYGDRCIEALAITEGGFPYDVCMNVGLQIPVPDSMIRQWQEVRIQRRMGAYSTEDIAHFKKKVGEFWIIRGSTGEEILTNVIKSVETKACSIIGIDSLQGLQPSVDSDKEMDENEKRAAHAAMVGRFFKKYIPLTTGLSGVNETTLIVTQQVRSNPDKANAPAHLQKYIKDFAIAGSYAAKHFKLIDLMLMDGSLIKKDGSEGEGKNTVGKVIKWFTEKGKAGTHDNIHGEVQYRYDIPKGIDLAQTIMDTAMAKGVLRQAGRGYTLIRPETGEVLSDYSAPSLKAFKKCLEMDFSFEKAVRLEILAAAGIQCLYA